MPCQHQHGTLDTSPLDLVSHHNWRARADVYHPVENMTSNHVNTVTSTIFSLLCHRYLGPPPVLGTMKTL